MASEASESEWKPGDLARTGEGEIVERTYRDTWIYFGNPSRYSDLTVGELIPVKAYSEAEIKKMIRIATEMGYDAAKFDACGCI